MIIIVCSCGSTDIMLGKYSGDFHCNKCGKDKPLYEIKYVVVTGEENANQNKFIFETIQKSIDKVFRQTG